MKNLTILFFVLIPFSISSQNLSGTINPELSYLQEAERQFRQLNFDKAISILDNALYLNPDSYETYILSARYHKIIGREKESLSYYNKAKQINPYSPYLYGYYGNNGLLKLMSFQPNASMEALTNDQKLNYYYEAIDHQVLKNNISNSEINALYAIITSIELNELDDAMEKIDSLLSIDSNSTIGLNLKGLIFKKKNKVNEALIQFNKALDLKPDFAITYYNLGNIDFLNKDYGSAIKKYSKAIQLQSKLTKAYFERAIAHKAIGDYSSAIKDYDSIIELKGKWYTEAYLNKGLTKKMDGDFEGAQGDLKQIISEYPNNPELRKNLGNLNLLFGFPEVAIENYTTAIKLKPDYPEAYYNRALGHFQRYDKVSGCEDLKTSLELGYQKSADLQRYFCGF